MIAVVLRLVYQGRPVLVRVDHAALAVRDLVEIAGHQLGQDGTPHGRIWLTVDVRKLRPAVVGYVEMCQLSDTDAAGIRPTHCL